MRALRTEKGERYQSAEELRDEIQQHLYRMNPTISADALAAFTREQFAGEIEIDRSMLRSLSQTDVAPFRGQISDGTSHTVSFALAGGLLPHSLPGSATHPTGGPPSATGPVVVVTLAPVLVPPAGQVPLGPAAAEAARSAPPRKAAGTRRLSVDEQRVAVLAGGPGLPVSATMMVPLQPRWPYIAAAAVGVLVIGGVTAALVLSHTDGRRLVGKIDPPVTTEAGRRRGATARDARPDPDHGRAAAARADGRVGRDARRPTAETGPTPDSTVAADAGGATMTFPPETVHQTKGKKGARKGAKKAAKKQREVASPALVQSKFKQVRAEYQQFTRLFGRQLDGEWDQILFANTYDNMDQYKHQRLNQMLDRLRKRMKEIRDAAGR